MKTLTSTPRPHVFHPEGNEELEKGFKPQGHDFSNKSEVNWGPEDLPGSWDSGRAKNNEVWKEGRWQ